MIILHSFVKSDMPKQDQTFMNTAGTELNALTDHVYTNGIDSYAQS